MSWLAVGRGLGDPEQPAMSSLAVARGLEDLELWLAGLFTAAELAAAQLLLQLRAAGADDEAAASASTTPSSSPHWVSPWGEDFAVQEKQQQQFVQETALPLVSTELDRRARKRYRFISDIYAATSPVTAAAKKRKRHHHGDTCHGSPSSSEPSMEEEEATRYGPGPGRRLLERESIACSRAFV